MRRVRAGERGVTLVPLVFTTAILIIAVSVAYLDASSKTYELAQHRADKARAQYLAEGAFELAVGALEDEELASEVRRDVELGEGRASLSLAPLGGFPGRYRADCRGVPARAITARRIEARIDAVLQVSVGPDGRRRVMVVSRDQM